MCKHYLDVLTPNLFAKMDNYGGTNELSVFATGHYELMVRLFEHDAKFLSRTTMGMGALAVFCMVPREFQISTDCRILDFMFERGLIGGLNRPFFPYNDCRFKGTPRFTILQSSIRCDDNF